MSGGDRRASGLQGGEGQRDRPGSAAGAGPVHPTDRAQDGAPHEAAPTLLVRYTSGSAIEPPPDLAARIVERLSRVPPPADPRAVVSRLVRLEGRAATRELRHVAGAVTDRRTPLLLRVQGLVLVLVLALATGAIGVAGAATVGPVLRDLVDHPRPTPRESDSPGIDTSVPVRPSTRGVISRAPTAGAPAGSGAARGRASDAARESPDQRMRSRASTRPERAPAAQARSRRFASHRTPPPAHDRAPRPTPAASPRPSGSKTSGDSDRKPAFDGADVPGSAERGDAPARRQR